MQRRHGARGEIFKKGKVQEIDMEMQNIEFVRAPAHLVKQGQMRRKIRFQRGGIEADRSGAHGHKSRPGSGVRACEQGDVVAKSDKGINEMGNDPFGAPVQTRRNGFVKGRNLGDLHFIVSVHGPSSNASVWLFDPG